MIDSMSTGIRGLDKMLGGGLPRRQSIIVMGGPGVGKTLLCMQFLYEGAKKGERGLFISLEETPERIVDNCIAAFPEWKDLPKLVEKEMIKIRRIDKWTYEQFVEMIKTHVAEAKTQRTVIDSLSIMELYFDKPYEFRKKVFELMKFLAGVDTTTLLTAETGAGEHEHMRNPAAQFVADGVIILYKLEKKEKRVRALEILKMRGVGHSTDLVPIAITPAGIEVYVGEKVY